MAAGKHTVYLSLGANLGDRKQNLGKALALLQAWGLRIRAVSSLYETAPWGVTDQPAFLNIAVRAATDLTPQSLLDLCKRVEHNLGRRPGQRWGPREVDVDILFFDGATIAEPDLEVPHPRLRERDFVLVPLAELTGDRPLPVFGCPASFYLRGDKVELSEAAGWWRDFLEVEDHG